MFVSGVFGGEGRGGGDEPLQLAPVEPETSCEAAEAMREVRAMRAERNFMVVA